MDVDSPSGSLGTPNGDDYASVVDSDDSSRRNSPGYFEYEQVVDVKNSRESSNGDAGGQYGANGANNGVSSNTIAPDITYEMDLDNSEDDEQLEVQQVALTARRTVSERT